MFNIAYKITPSYSYVQYCIQNNAIIFVGHQYSVLNNTLVLDLLKKYEYI